ncbi:hypothetical protein [Algoriphagus algorifonticola]|uniref:hypothetical protein n=1 Tax=Algoriphagus algorifonticola TaxID=2593007 RepID=UPI00119CCC9E|nr:hypothetical protein [Algoriphagus algorifonticola]
MRLWLKKNLWVFDILMMGLILATLTFMIKFVPYGVDIKIHNFFLIEYLENGYFPIPPGYYFLLYLLDLLISYKFQFLVSSILLMTGFLWWKFRITVKWIFESSSLGIQTSYLLAFLFFFLGPIVIPSIDREYWYLGKFSQIIWHNSTIIAAFPFCLLLVKQTLSWWENYSNRAFLNICLLVVTILLIKPSFLFCYLPVFLCYTFYLLRRPSQPFILAVCLSVFSLLLIWIEKILIFQWDPMVVNYYSQEDIPRVVLEPFKIWFHYSNEPFYDLLSSIPLTLCFLIFWRRKAFENRFFSFSFWTLLLAILIYFLLAETGYREYHGNFYWQIPVALYLHNLSMLLIVLKEHQEKNEKSPFRIKIFASIFSIQVVFGFAYWLRIFFERIIS